MVERPLADKRPFGPVVDLNRVKRRMNNMVSGGKSVVGTAGTPFPNRPKNDMYLTYVLDGDHIFETAEFNNVLRRKIKGRPEYSNWGVNFKKSGSSSKGTFEQQASIIRVPGGELPFNDEDIHAIEGIINRTLRDNNLNTEVAQVIIDQG